METSQGHVKEGSLVFFRLEDPAVRHNGVITSIDESSTTVCHLESTPEGLALRQTEIQHPGWITWLMEDESSGLSTGCLALLAFIHPHDSGKMKLPEGWAKFIANENDLRRLMHYYSCFSDCLERASAFGNNLLPGFLETTWSDRLRVVAPGILLTEFAWLAMDWRFKELKEAGVFSLGQALLGLYPFDPEGSATDMATVLGVLLGQPDSHEEQKDPERHALLNALLPRLMQTTERGRWDDIRNFDYGAEILERLPDDLAFLCADRLLSADPTDWFHDGNGMGASGHPIIVQAFIERAATEDLLDAALNECAYPEYRGNAFLYMNALPRRNSWTGFALSCLLGSYYREWEDPSTRDVHLPRFIRGLEERLDGTVGKRLRQLYPGHPFRDSRLLELVRDRPELMLYGFCLRGKDSPRIERFEYRIKDALEAAKKLAAAIRDIGRPGKKSFGEWIDAVFAEGAPCLDPARVAYIKNIAVRM